jgi:hypothetical protein
MCFKKIFCVVAWFFRKSTVFNNEVLLGSKYEDEKKGQLSFSEPLTLYINKLTVLMVDGTGFEPAASAMPTLRSFQADLPAHDFLTQTRTLLSIMGEKESRISEY